MVESWSTRRGGASSSVHAVRAGSCSGVLPWTWKIDPRLWCCLTHCRCSRLLRISFTPFRNKARRTCFHSSAAAWRWPRNCPPKRKCLFSWTRPAMDEIRALCTVKRFAHEHNRAQDWILERVRLQAQRWADLMSCNKITAMLQTALIPRPILLPGGPDANAGATAATILVSKMILVAISR